MSDAAPTIGDCHVCEALIPALLGPSPSQTIGTIDALIMRSNLPCHTCSIILFEIRDSLLGSSDLELSGDTPLKLEIKDSNTPVKVSILDEDTSAKLGELILSLEDPGLPLLPPMAPHEVKSEEFFSRPAWNPANTPESPALPRLWTASYIAAWLAACNRDHHKLCAQPLAIDLPTRLIRIHPDGTLSLIHTASLPLSSRDSLVYATVSHVWGSSTLLRLFTTNIHAFTVSIPLASLPPKFLAIIHLATLLSTSHLWIDTLCIIQDSRADWAREGARMASVYRHTALNFALVGSAPDDAVLPTHAGNVHGLIRKRIRLLHPARGPLSLYLAPSGAVVRRMFNSGRGRPPLFTRGWVMQERFLARRSVFLGEAQMAWECGTCLWVEGTGARDHYGELSFEAYSKRLVVEAAAAAAEGRTTALGWRRHWDKFVIAYTSAGLTYTSDKLAVVAGIARAFRELSGHEYVGGIWREHVTLGGLLWKVDPDAARRPAFRGAPSWSWASVDGAVSNLPVFVRQGAGDPWRFHVPTTELVDLQVKWATGSDAVYGEVEEAVVTSRGG